MSPHTLTIRMRILSPSSERSSIHKAKLLKESYLIDLKLRVIAETVQDVSLGKSGYLMVIDDKGESIYTPDHPLVSKFQRSWIDESLGYFF